MTLEFNYETTSGRMLWVELEYSMQDASFDHAFGREKREEMVIDWKRSRFYVEHNNARREINCPPAFEVPGLIEYAERKAYG